jgi:hypothetical protein
MALFAAALGECPATEWHPEATTALRIFVEFRHPFACPTRCQLCAPIVCQEAVPQARDPVDTYHVFEAPQKWHSMATF